MSPIEFKLGQKLERYLFTVLWWSIFRFMPHQFSFIYIFILRKFGAKVSKGCKIYCSSTIWMPRNLFIGRNSCIGPRCKIYNVAEIRLGNNSLISQDTTLCTASHNFRSSDFELTGSPITVGDGVWVASECFVGPGVTLGTGVMVCARSAVFDSVAPKTTVIGNPATKKER